STRSGCRSFFFSSRRRHTRCLSDWSSDVCSSDLQTFAHLGGHIQGGNGVPEPIGAQVGVPEGHGEGLVSDRDCYLDLRRSDWCRSEERRVGNEGRSRLSAAAGEVLVMSLAVAAVF